jgi:hypothetical protein
MDKNKLLWIQAILFGVIFTTLAHVELFKDRIWLQLIVYIGITLISEKIINALSRR